jgi:hypothetical protein
MPRDDCEALGYTLLELWLGEMPWALTTNAEAAAGWSQERLQEMARMKDSLIRQGIAEVRCQEEGAGAGNKVGVHDGASTAGWNRSCLVPHLIHCCGMHRMMLL